MMSWVYVVFQDTLNDTMVEPWYFVWSALLQWYQVVLESLIWKCNRLQMTIFKCNKCNYLNYFIKVHFLNYFSFLNIQWMISTVKHFQTFKAGRVNLTVELLKILHHLN